jgi:hypothetical protein
MQQVAFNTFREERPLEGIRSPGDQHQDIKDRKRNGDSPGSYPRDPN